MTISMRDGTFVAADDVVSSSLDGGAALLDLKTSTYYSLNAVGAHLWSLLASPRSTDELQTAIAERYEVDRERSDADVVAILGELYDAGLIRSDTSHSHAAA